MTHWFRRSWRFQSTLPARGATHLLQPIGLLYRNFNPRSPHGERPSMRVRTSRASVISIHAPRTGSDPRDEGGMPRPPDFNPRSPHGERRNRRHHSRPPQNFNPRSPHGERLGVTTTQEMLESISIHAPRTGSDRAAGTKRGTSRQFQSTLPARGATGAEDMDFRMA